MNGFFERILAGEQLYISYGADLNNINLFTRYGFTLDDQLGAPLSNLV